MSTAFQAEPGPAHLRFPDVAERIDATSVRLAFQRYVDKRGRRIPRVCDWHVIVEFEGEGRMYMLEVERRGRLDKLPSQKAIETGARSAAEHLRALERRLRSPSAARQAEA